MMAESYGTTSFELLAPAGSLPILKEVIAAGADAVYVGGSRFGARAYAENFSDEELCEAIDYVHLYGRKLYLTVNTLLKNTEMDELCEYIRLFYEHGLDAVIVQDFGVIHLLRHEFPDLPLHASTQMTITGSDGARMLGELGISRVVLSRELSIAEMARIHKETGMELEVFVHGALCYSYSGQCLFSSMLGGRSGNRGRCAQPCRLPYQICGQKDKASYLLSLKDLCGINDLAALRDAGVYSLKIEGRMKQAAYAAGVTAYYRKYIDNLAAQTDKGRHTTSCNITAGNMTGCNVTEYDVTECDVTECDVTECDVTECGLTSYDNKGLLALGNRSGFTNGYYHKRNGSDMVTFEKPSYTTEGKGSGQAKSKSKDEKIPIRGWAYFHMGEKSCVTVAAEHLSEHPAVTVTVTGQAPQAASKLPVTEDQIQQRLLKTGDTPFEFEELAIDADEGIFLPNGELNRMRREALAQLQEELLALYRRSYTKYKVDRTDIETGVTDRIGIESGVVKEPDLENQQSEKHFRWIALVSSPEQLDAVLADGRMTDIYLETVCHPREKMLDILFREVSSITSGISEAIYHPRIFLALPPIFRAHTEEFYSDIADELRKLPIQGFLIRNYEEFAWTGRMFPGYKRILDANVYTCNDEAVRAFADLGADGNTVPLELNRNEIPERENRYSEMAVYGYYPLMVSAQCVHANTTGSHTREMHHNLTCDRKPCITHIRDRKGIEFPVCNFCSECVNVIYNSVPTMLFSRMDELKRAGIQEFRLNFTIEDADMVRKVLQMLPDRTGRNHNNGQIDFPHTNGHYTRGVK